MAEQVQRLRSKIVQYNTADDAALCDDGSVWYYDGRPDCKKWTQIHPPHEPQPQTADLAEALAALRRLVDFQCYGIEDIGCRDLFRAAEAVLRKHGA
jgi:hypothetical protein